MATATIATKRTQIEILHDLLSECPGYDEGVSKTALRYRCNLGNEQVGRYISFMLSRDLVSRNHQGRISITRRGEELLGKMDNVLTLVRSLESD